MHLYSVVKRIKSFAAIKGQDLCTQLTDGANVTDYNLETSNPFN